MTSTVGDSPSAFGNRIAAAAIAYGLADGSNQAGGYADPDYASVNPPLVVETDGPIGIFRRWSKQFYESGPVPGEAPQVSLTS